MNPRKRKTPVRGLRKRIETAKQDICPKCGGELDTGWECNDCGFDARPLAYNDLDAARARKDKA